MGFLDKILSKAEQEKLSGIARKAKQEISSLPIISAIGDATQGMSGLSEIQQEIKKNPMEPLHWLAYYEAFKTYKRMSRGVDVGRAIINPVGFVLVKGVAGGLNTLDKEYEAFDPRKCLGMAISLTMKNLKNKALPPNRRDLVILAKALTYSVAYANGPQKDKMLQRAILYITRAIDLETSKQKKAEFFFYLAEFYSQTENEKMRMRALNISRKLGFEPAHELLKEILKKQATDEAAKSKIENVKSDTPYRIFEFTYQPKLEDRLENTWEHVKTQQQQKFSDTGKRISDFMKKW